MTVCEANIDFYSMQYSLLINVFVVGLGAVFFFLTAIWIVRDKIKAENPEAYKNAKNSTNPETKEMLGIMESGRLEDCTDDDIPPTMIMPQTKMRQVTNDLSCSEATKPRESSIMLEERKTSQNSAYQPLNNASLSKFQRLLDTPDTSSERLDGGQLSTSSSTPTTPATPKSLRG